MGLLLNEESSHYVFFLMPLLTVADSGFVHFNFEHCLSGLNIALL